MYFLIQLICFCQLTLNDFVNKRANKSLSNNNGSMIYAWGISLGVGAEWENFCAFVIVFKILHSTQLIYRFLYEFRENFLCVNLHLPSFQYSSLNKIGKLSGYEQTSNFRLSFKLQGIIYCEANLLSWISVTSWGMQKTAASRVSSHKKLCKRQSVERCLTFPESTIVSISPENLMYGISFGKVFAVILSSKRTRSEALVECFFVNCFWYLLSQNVFNRSQYRAESLSCILTRLWVNWTG